MTTTTPTTLSTALASSGFPLHPSTHFLSTLLSPSSSSSSSTHTIQQPPLPALVATAKLRLLSSDFTTSPCVLAPAPTTGHLPADISDPRVRERRLGSGANSSAAAIRGSTGNGNGGSNGNGNVGGAAKIPVQVSAVEDLSRSRWEQLEAIEAMERGEMTKGREIIRVVETDERTTTATAAAGVGTGPGAGPHRLVLQDVKGTTVYGLELKPVKGVGMGMSIGTKMLLSGVTVARGVLLLEPETAMVLGGKIESLHKAWVENRKADLLAAIDGAA